MIETAHLYGPLHEQLMELLRGLPADAWRRPTVCKGWTVQDIASHMLDTQIRTLSTGRDAHVPPPPDGDIGDWNGLVAFLNRLNGEWVGVTRRMSPRMLVSMLAITGPELAEYVTGLDPHVAAPIPVAWAGESQSANWFHIGRDYTEYWHHQQQIRDAVGANPLTSREWLHPVIALFVRALPPAYQRMSTPASIDAIRVDITGDAGGTWFLVRKAPGKRWTLAESQARGDVEPAIELSDDTAWRFLTKGMSADEARPHVRCKGGDTAALVEPFLHARAIMG